MLRELRGQSCIALKDPLEKKQMIATTRMFGTPVFEAGPLREAVATYTARAAEKLRRQHSAATSLDVFVVTSGNASGSYVYEPRSDHRYAILPRPTSVTHELLAHVLPLVEQLYRPGMKYLKAGVVLGGLVPVDAIQGNLFMPSEPSRGGKLMGVIDNLNASMRDDIIKYAASGMSRNWKMRQELRSRRFTTRWAEIYEVH